MKRSIVGLGLAALLAACSSKPLEAFVRDLKHEPAARTLAYDLLVKVDATAPERLIPGFIDDPSPELRREAVQQFIDAGNKAVEAKQDTQAKAAFQRAMQSARDDDQIKILVKQLASYGDAPKPSTMETVEFAAWTMVANLILNLDETITKE